MRNAPPPAKKNLLDLNFCDCQQEFVFSINNITNNTNNV